MTEKCQLKLLMVSTEYPPMKGGVGRYTYNLVKAMQEIGIDTHVVSGEEGNGNYKGLSPYNKNNSDLLLKIVNESQPDIVHIQMEHGLYGLNFRSLVPGKITTSLDSFYSKCPKPIVTTFHSAYDFKEWVNLDPNFQRTGYLEKIKWKIRKLRNYWFRSINYEPFNNLNEQILNHSKAGIVFSHYLCNFIPGCKVIYHGSEPAFPEKITKQFARKKLHLPENGRIALSLGFFTFTKGWDIINKIDIPKNWTIILNHSRNYFSSQEYNLDFNESRHRDRIMNLNKDYLSEEEMSLLLYASDIVFLPYRVSSGSGVMFDGFGHDLPFLASSLGFFKEFEDLHLGMTIEGKPEGFTKGLEVIDTNYDMYLSNVIKFKEKLRWCDIATQHVNIYKSCVEREKNIKSEILIN